jgi:hypothetical protein
MVLNSNQEINAILVGNHHKTTTKYIKSVINVQVDNDVKTLILSKSFFNLEKKTQNLKFSF